jgi:hypothetical protein
MDISSTFPEYVKANREKPVRLIKRPGYNNK